MNTLPAKLKWVLSIDTDSFTFDKTVQNYINKNLLHRLDIPLKVENNTYSKFRIKHITIMKSNFTNFATQNLTQNKKNHMQIPFILLGSCL